MRWPIQRGAFLRVVGPLVTSVAVIGACGGSTGGGSNCDADCKDVDASSGGAGNVGGVTTGGTSAGGASAGGTSAGGTSAGGTSAGGTSAGGTSAGGTSAGGTSAGGTSAGGTGGATAQSSIGRACASNAECKAPEFCAKFDSGDFGGEGPAKGYCTVQCTSGGDTTCQAVDPDSHCFHFSATSAHCVDECTPGPPNLNAMDPDKCRGRPEVACAPVYGASGSIAFTACIPQCNADWDCGTTLHCNHKTGLCTSAVISGLAIGAACAPPLDGGTDQCAGSCTGFASSSTGDIAYVCAEPCVMGAMPACGWSGPGSGPAPAACIYSVASTAPTGLGDLGSCGELCNCDSACVSPMKCLPWTGPNAQALKEYFGRSGYCGAADGIGAGTLSCDGG